MASIIDPLYAVVVPAMSGVSELILQGWSACAGVLSKGSMSIAAVQQQAKWSVIPMPWADYAAENYVNIPLGLQDFVTAKFLATFFASYALMAVLPWLPPRLRHAWCAITGLLMVQFVFGVGYLNIVGTSLFSYIVLAAGQAIRPLRGWAHVFSGLVCFAYLCMRHITRSNVNASSIDDSIVQMVLTIKLYTLGYNLFDGTADADSIKAGIKDAMTQVEKDKNDKAAKWQLQLLQDRQQRGISALPPFIDFLGYVMNPSTLMAGPAFEFSEYNAAITRPGLPNAPRLVPVAWKFIFGLTTLAFSAIYKAIMPVSAMYDHAVLVNSGSPDAPSLLYRMLYSQAAIMIIRCQYYGCWKLAEGAAVLGGFGYRSSTKGSVVFSDIEWLVGASNLRSVCQTLFGSTYESTLALFGLKLTSTTADIPDWEGCSNVTPFAVETRRSPDSVIRVWNHFTQSWLERYIFKRAPRAWGLNRWFTFGASAFWHGFYSGYYLGFLSVPLLQDSVRALYEAGGPFMEAMGLGWVGTPAHTLTFAVVVLVEFIATQAAWMYILAAFNLFDAFKGIAVWRSVGYAGHLVPVSFFIIAAVLKALYGKKKGGDSKKITAKIALTADSSPKSEASSSEAATASPVRAGPNTPSKSPRAASPNTARQRRA